MKRIFLDWVHPLVPAAADWLIKRAGGEHGPCEMAEMICVVPGKRSGRVLLEELVRQCRAQDRHLVPPRIITPGGLVDELSSENAPRATEKECLLAWMQVLEDAQPELVAPLLPQPDKYRDLLSRHELALTIHALHRELSGERRTFHDAAATVQTLDLPAEADRWLALAALQCLYESQFEACGLVDPFRARQSVLDAEACQLSSFKEIILIGIAELNASQRAALGEVASHGTAIVHAPESECENFDAFGCVIADCWQSRMLKIADESIVIADLPSDQARAAMNTLAAVSDTYACDEITIGLSDAALVPSLDAAARWAECTIHHPDGRSALQTAPVCLLSAIADWLTEPRFEYFAAMLRHPDLESWLFSHLKSQVSYSNSQISSLTSEISHPEEIDPAREDWLSLLDRYFADHLSGRLSGEWLGSAGRVRQIYSTVRMLLKPLETPRDQRLGAWCSAVRAILTDVYGMENDALDAMSRDACLKIHDALVDIESVHGALQPNTDGATALHLILREVEQAMIPQPMRDNDVEALGWLELHLDPAPALILIGVNDGDIPKSITSHAFLPDSLRTKLGLANDRRRLARDAYLLQAIVNSRSFVQLITGRRDVEGNPLMPSRLLLQCARPDLPQRVRRLTDPNRAQRERLPRGVRATTSTSRFIVPAADPEVPIPDSISVTAFRTYLACPFCFWLRHVLRIEAMEDRAHELDPLDFGSLVHAILQNFGRDTSIRDSDDPEAISAFLQRQLDEIARENYGRHAVPAVRVQLERLRIRLDAFAECQAQLRRDGWTIEQAEYKLPDDTVLEVPGDESVGPMRIRGKIDRIDRHETTGTIRIIDYKTSENATSPMKAHRGRERWNPEDDWIDLQLPLYRHLVAQHGYTGKVEVGYLQLPSDPSGTTFCAANWDEAQIEDAVERARGIIRCIRRGEFDRNPDALEFTEFANILHFGSFRDDAADESAEDAP